MYEHSAMGWSPVYETPTNDQRVQKLCLEYPQGRQYCFTENERQFAHGRACEQIGWPCSTADNNPGDVWCCPPGFPDFSVGPAAPTSKAGIIMVALALGVGALFVYKRLSPQEEFGV
jgi:hypothetical protein